MSFTSATNSASVAAALQLRVLGEDGVVTRQQPRQPQPQQQEQDAALAAAYATLSAEIRRLTEVVEALDRKLDNVVSRNEYEEARRQNSLIRSGAPVPAFKEHVGSGGGGGGGIGFGGGRFPFIF